MKKPIWVSLLLIILSGCFDSRQLEPYSKGADISGPSAVKVVRGDNQIFQLREYSYYEELIDEDLEPYTISGGLLVVRRASNHFWGTLGFYDPYFLVYNKKGSIELTKMKYGTFRGNQAVVYGDDSFYTFCMSLDVDASKQVKIPKSLLLKYNKSLAQKWIRSNSWPLVEYSSIYPSGGFLSVFHAELNDGDNGMYLLKITDTPLRQPED